MQYDINLNLVYNSIVIFIGKLNLSVDLKHVWNQI